MNETRRIPTTGTQFPTLFVKWQEIFCHTDMVGHTKAFDYPFMDHWRGGGSQGGQFFRSKADANRRPAGPVLQYVLQSLRIPLPAAIMDNCSSTLPVAQSFQATCSGSLDVIING